jgi:2-succinyl-5-enolpyruvyl-6-hydroxy-3-cyclohexene-1-carboxylate synthase
MKLNQCIMRSPVEGTDRLAEICFQKGIKSVVISPGSRNAPLISSFTNHKGIDCLSIVDERSAAYFALGMAQQSAQTVALVCTSGTAVLNFAPAIAEAYYQKIPLLILTADRPVEWIGQSDNQTIKQQNIYSNYIKQSFHLPMDIIDFDSLWYYERVINEAINLCAIPSKGPVHINIPLTEPLYSLSNNEKISPKIIEFLPVEKKMNIELLQDLQSQWSKAKGKMILAGMLAPDDELKRLLEEINKDPDVVILVESNSNLCSEHFYDRIDHILTLAGKKIEMLQPEILLTIGTNTISKRIKQFLRKNKPRAHWHIEETTGFPDTFQSLTLNIPMSPKDFFQHFLNSYIPSENKSYNEHFKKLAEKSLQKHNDFLSSCPFSDLKAIEIILKAIPNGSNIQLGNSSPVRYAQFFPLNPAFFYNSNRGTSGIDGNVSTAVGASYKTKAPVTLIVGDIAFFYDSNGLWNRYLSDNLRIILLNNGGGGIFRLIEGPAESTMLEEFFETSHNNTAEGICQSFNLKYYKAADLEDLNKILPEFFSSGNKGAALLEIFTPSKKNAEIFRSYFSFLKAST